MLVNSESTLKLCTRKEIRLLINDSSVKRKETFTVNSLVNKGFKIGTKNFASL